MVASAAVAVALRFFTRHQQESRTLADDFAVLARLVLQGSLPECERELTICLDPFYWDVYSNDN